jgi:membrane protein DedA with SNARE-associated domain
MNILLAPSSYLAIVLVLILSGTGIPIPEEVPVIAAGILASRETLDPLMAFACCLFGALIGDCVMYWVGYHFGRNVLSDHHWWARFVTPQREAQVEAQFRQHGLKVFFVARFLVGLRSPVYLTAGILQVSFRRFLLIDLVCATSVVSTFFWLTYFFGRHIAQWVGRAEVLLTVVVSIVLACVAFYLWRRRRRWKAAEAEKGRAGATCLPVQTESPLDPVKGGEESGSGAASRLHQVERLSKTE